ncbi:MAG: hypothetical protein ACI3Y0_08640 [Prevotella sp.]
MKHTIVSLMAFTVVGLCLATSACAQSLGKYRTRKLADMAGKLGIVQKLDTLGTGIYYFPATYGGNSLTIEKKAGRVEHIGLSIFSEVLRREQPSPVYNFIERYALDIALRRIGTELLSQQLKLDRVTFEKGNLATLPTLFADTTLTIGIANHAERAYTVEWRRGETVVCRMFFPSNYELLQGSKMLENEERLKLDILSHDTNADKTVSPDTKRLVESNGLLALDMGYNSIESMRNRRYFRKTAVGGNDSLAPVCSSRYPLESVANLFTGNDIDNDFDVEIKQLKYHFKKDTYSVKISQLIGFCLDEGCCPYFGVVSYDEVSGEIDAVVEMRNHQEAYEHLMRVRMNVKDLDRRKGKINVTLTGYIMTHDIEDLYND